MQGEADLLPAQAELVTKASALGQLSLALRPLDSDDDAALTAKDRDGQRQVALSDSFGGEGGPLRRGPLIIRYGIANTPANGNSAEASQRPQ